MEFLIAFALISVFVIAGMIHQAKVERKRKAKKAKKKKKKEQNTAKPKSKCCKHRYVERNIYDPNGTPIFRTKKEGRRCKKCGKVCKHENVKLERVMDSEGNYCYRCPECGDQWRIPWGGHPDF